MCDAGREVVDGRGLMEAGQPPLVVLALVGVVGLDVPLVVLAQPVDGGLDLGHAALMMGTKDTIHYLITYMVNHDKFALRLR